MRAICKGAFCRQDIAFDGVSFRCLSWSKLPDPGLTAYLWSVSFDSLRLQSKPCITFGKRSTNTSAHNREHHSVGVRPAQEGFHHSTSNYFNLQYQRFLFVDLTQQFQFSCRANGCFYNGLDLQGKERKGLAFSFNGIRIDGRLAWSGWHARLDFVRCVDLWLGKVKQGKAI